MLDELQIRKGMCIMSENKNNVEYWIDESNLKWYTRQFDSPYRITVAFEKFLSNQVNIDNKNILDIACGPGASTSYIARKHRSSFFMGIDINTKLFDLYKGTDENIKFGYGDIYNLDDNLIGKYDGVICQQTLSWLPEYKRPLEQICKLGPKWIAFSSLLYDGKINYTISLENYEKPMNDKAYSQVYYNIYSVFKISELLELHGYKNILYQPFEIDIDIEKPEHKNLGYYTVKTSNEKRLAFNTCLYQPEGFMFASR